MAVPYDSLPPQSSDFASLRDSFYILMHLNQYKMKPVISMTREAEGLLRIVLFSGDLKLLGTRKTLSQLCCKLAKDLRNNRRRGVVPIFISTLWFIVALGISIEAAFGSLGSNSQAHNLAMGLFIAWFPVLVLCSILHRNPVGSDDIQRKFNKLVDHVCVALLDASTRHAYIHSFHDLPHAHQMAYWVDKIAEKAVYIQGDYFWGFAGQARTRFHYGAAHAILVDVERAYLAERGRNWFGRDQRGARASLVLGQVDREFTWFDWRQLWQVTCSIILVGGTSAGAFVLSFNTPIVGLGCRAGGYLIFFVVAMALLVVEIGVWWFTSPLRHHERFQEQLQECMQQTSLGSDHSPRRPKHISLPGLASSKAVFAKCLKGIEIFTIWLARFWIRLLPFARTPQKLDDTTNSLRAFFASLYEMSTRDWLQVLFFTPLEFANMSWGCYLIMAQTTGAYNNCACMTSSWGTGGGYIDFAQIDEAPGSSVAKYWIQGTIVTCVIMSLGMGYIVVEWLFQAHLSTSSYPDAMQGLSRVRLFRSYIHWARYPSALFVLLVNPAFRACGMRSSGDDKALLWRKDSCYKPRVADAVVRLTGDVQCLTVPQSDGIQSEGFTNTEGKDIEVQGGGAGAAQIEGTGTPVGVEVASVSVSVT